MSPARTMGAAARRAAPPLLLVVLAACSSDLFHGTDWTSLCQTSPDAIGCTAGTTSAASTTSSSGGGGTGGTGGSSTTTTSSSSASSSSAAGGSGGTSDPGCADGEREGFLSLLTHPDIAACAGGWSIEGILGGGPAAVCAHGGGDDGPLPDGTACAAADLCAAGWHVCKTSGDVASHSPDGCAAVLDGATPGAFFATGQSSSGGALCDAVGANDVFGCGDLGDPVDPACAPLDRFSNNSCMALPAPWSCGSDILAEASHLTKGGPASGGVLCCRD